MIIRNEGVRELMIGFIHKEHPKYEMRQTHVKRPCIIRQIKNHKLFASNNNMKNKTTQNYPFSRRVAFVQETFCKSIGKVFKNKDMMS